MRVRSAPRVASSKRFVPPFRNGDHMDQKTFHALYLKTPEGFKAELIGGIVYVASPVSFNHGRPHARVVGWLFNYTDATPGTELADNATFVLGDESELQPDACLVIVPECGGGTAVNEDGYLVGAAELVVEVAHSSAAIDLHRKRRDYEAAGVREYLVVLAEPEQAVWFVRGNKGFAEMKPGPDGLFRSRVFPGLWLDPAGLFERSPRRLLKALPQGLTSPEHAAFAAKLEKAAKRKTKPNGSK